MLPPMRPLACAVLLVALPLAGCTLPGTSSPGAGVACRPGDGDDPYPSDEIFAERSADMDGDRLVLQACLVNGKDEVHREDCGSAAGPIEVRVRHASSDELVYARPHVDDAFIKSCQVRELAANEEWVDARFEERWDLRKDVCRDDDSCDRDGEGERVRGGEYVVEIDYPRFVEEFRKRVEIPPP